MDDSILNEEEEEEIKEVKIKKAPLITFAKLNKYYTILFICPIFSMLVNYFLSKIVKANVIKQSSFFSILLEELTYIFAGLFYFISYFKGKSNRPKKFDKNFCDETSIKYIYNSPLVNNCSKKVIIFCVILSCLLISDKLICIYTDKYKLFYSRFYYLLFIPLFSKLILKENLYKHQYLSLLISIIGMVIIDIPICLKITKDDLLANFINLIDGAVFPLFIVLIKFIYNKYYVMPLKTSLVLGLISLSATLIGFIIYSLIKYHDLTFFNAFDFSNIDNKLTISIYLILVFLFSIIFQLLALLILFYFSPILLLVSEVISPFLLWIVMTIENNNKTKLELAIYPIGYIIVLFSSLIYNEIVIFNFCGLSQNTKKFVDQRMIKEISEMNKLMNNDDLQDI